MSGGGARLSGDPRRDRLHYGVRSAALVSPRLRVDHAVGLGVRASREDRAGAAGSSRNRHIGSAGAGGGRRLKRVTNKEENVRWRNARYAARALMKRRYVRRPASR